MCKISSSYRYMYDTHVHTSQTSLCAKIKGAEIVNYYSKLGYSGIMVTDHFECSENFIARNEVEWEKKIDRFLIGYQEAKQRGEETDFDVLLGMEYCYKHTEFIFTNLTKMQLYKAQKVLQETNLIRILKWVRDCGGYIIHVHPFRVSQNINIIRLVPDYIDAVEVYNGGNVISWPKANEIAEYYANKIGKAKTSGSDFHSKDSGLMGGMIFESRIHNEREFVKEMQRGQYTLIRTELC